MEPSRSYLDAHERRMLERGVFFGGWEDADMDDAVLAPLERFDHRQVTGLMRRAGVAGPQACPRGLRHSWGVAAVTAGVPLTTIAAVLGHADVSTTAIYATAIGAQQRELVARVWQ